MAVILPCGQRGLILPGGPQTLDPRNFAVPDGLVGYWGFDADCLDSNYAYDLSGNGFNGTLAGTTKPSFAQGQVGGALQFYKAASFIDLGPIFNYTSQPFSFALSVKLASFDSGYSGQGPCLFWKGSYGVDGYYATILPNGSVTFFTNGTGGVIRESATDPGVITIGAWFRILYSRSGSSVRIYVNGVDCTNTVGVHTDPKTSTNSFQIGRYSTIIGLDGVVDEFKNWNRSLASWEVIQDYQAGLAGRRDAGQFMPGWNEMPMLGGL